MALAQGTHLVIRARLIRYQMLLGVAGECFLLEVTAASAFLNLATLAPLSLILAISMVEHIVRRASSMDLG